MSSVAQSFVGTWKVDNTPSASFKEYLKATGLAEETIDRAVKAEVEVDWRVNGQQVTQTIRTKTKSHTMTFTLGVEFTDTNLGGQVFQVTYTEVGGKMLVKMRGSPHNCTSSMELIGDEIIDTMTCESPTPVSCVRKMKRV
ncbi:fatty acid-binding protein, liver-like isoform X2 [Watersipora subatra]|uniref:fatty acid-binding protein, liver-like isoform X2 n=1 Tax=Watersipora subatra TaxID=2589382 RepID=UPI00355BB2BE